MSGPKATLDAILADLRAKQRNAAMRNKPTMWAYYLQMRRGLQRHFCATSDSAVAHEAIQLIQRAERAVSERPDRAAYRWALAVYATRILRAWRFRNGEAVVGCRRSLAWLKERAGEE